MKLKKGITDSSRKVAPLVCPDGAISIDSGIHNLVEVIAIIENHIKEKYHEFTLSVYLGNWSRIITVVVWL